MKYRGHILLVISLTCLIVLLFPEKSILAQTPKEPATVTAESGDSYEKGIQLFNEGKYSEAFSFFQTSFKLDKTNTAACFAMGLSLYRDGKHMESTEYFKIVLDHDPTHKKALSIYPAALFNAGEYEKASAAYDMSIETITDNHTMYFGKAKALIKMEMFENALPFIEKALSLSPADINYKYIYAQTLEESGKLKEASDAALEILAIDNSNDRARIIAADYFRISGKLNEALLYYTIASKNPAIKQYADYYIGEIKFELEERQIEKEWEKKNSQD